MAPTKTKENVREEREVCKLLKLSRADYNSSADIETRVVYLVKRYLLRECRGGSADWNVLDRRCDICRNLQPSAQQLITHRYNAHTTANHVYTCLICYNTFTCKYMLHIHVVTHTKRDTLAQSLDESDTNHYVSTPTHTTEKRAHKCTECPKTFTNKRHRYRYTRTQERPYECDVCHKRFIKSSNLSVHTRIHTGEKPYECEICYKHFTQLGNLHRHKKTHNGEKPYECRVCYKRFINSWNLRRHTGTHTGEELYECQICHTHFLTYADLLMHMTAHTGTKTYECDICYKHFTHISNMHRHKKTHNGEKPYECALCNRRFTRRFAMNVHKRIHTGEEPYKCDVCH